MRRNYITFMISIIAVLCCLPTMAIDDLSINQEITNLLQNPTFQDQFNGWTLTQQGGSLTVQEKTDGTFEVQSQGCEFTLEQTITDLPDGIYELQIDGYFAAEAMPQSTLHSSMIHMNNMKNVFISSDEFTQFHGESSNRVIAMSQDGKLTIKIIGHCPASSFDCTVFSNIHLFYRGQDEDKVEASNACYSLQSEMADLFTYIWECYSKDITDYVQHPSCNDSIMMCVLGKAYPSIILSNMQISQLYNNGNLLESVCESQAAYIKLMRNILQTENTANLLIANKLLTEQQYSQVTQLLDTANKGYTEGSFTNRDIDNLLQQMVALDGLPKYIDNVMQISTPQDLCSFSVLVNEGMRTLDAQLTTDINMAGVTTFQPIGLYSDNMTELNDFRTNSYGGTFNGQGFEVRNLTLQTAYEGGLFGRCYRAQISNLGIANVSITGTGAQTCGALAGTLMQTQIDNCYVAGTIQVSTNGKMAAQFVGEGAWNTCFNNCYTLGEDFTNATAAELNNCYWGTIATSAAKSGEMCYNLNNGETDSPIYYQTLGKDNYPVLLSSHEIVRRTQDGVYYNGDDEVGIIHIQEQGTRGKEQDSQAIYDLNGRRLTHKPAKSPYIQGGKIRL